VPRNLKGGGGGGGEPGRFVHLFDLSTEEDELGRRSEIGPVMVARQLTRRELLAFDQRVDHEWPALDLLRM